MTAEFASNVQIEGARYPSLVGKGVIVTGGGAGIGASLVEHFCAQGCKVGFVELNAEAAHTTTEAVAAVTGNRPAFAVADVRDIAALTAAIDTLSGATGPVSVLVNNAGNDEQRPLEEVTPDYWDERFATNLRHQFFASQALIDGMAAAGGGAIINMGSISWMRGIGGLVFYTTAKAAVMGLTKSLAREVGERRIRVNSIAPGWVLTTRQLEKASRVKSKFNEYLQAQCLKEHLLPPDVARMALWLAADDSRLVTGQTFIVDGGVI